VGKPLLLSGGFFLKPNKKTMALILKQKIQIDIQGVVLWVTDMTLQYDAVTNPGGWGAPNPEIGDQCLMVFAEQIKDDESGDIIGVPLTVLTEQFATNLTDYDHQFQLQLPEDGHFKISLFTFPVTTDGVDTLAGDAIQEGDVVFYNGQVQKKTDSGYDVIEDYTLLYDEPDVPQVLAEDLIYPNLLIARNNQMKSYLELRRGKCVKEEIDDARDALVDLDIDIQGMDYAFRANLTSKARKILKELTDQLGE
jgi:hypothetical protein